MIVKWSGGPNDGTAVEVPDTVVQIEQDAVHAASFDGFTVWPRRTERWVYPIRDGLIVWAEGRVLS